MFISQDINCLFFGWNICHTNNPIIYFLLDKMTIHLHMFCPITMKGIVSDTNSGIVVTKKLNGKLLEIFNYLNSLLRHIRSHMP